MKEEIDVYSWKLRQKNEKEKRLKVEDDAIDMEEVKDTCNLCDGKHSYASNFGSEKKNRNETTHVDTETL